MAQMRTMRMLVCLLCSHAASCAILSCYTDYSQMEPEKVDPFLCTHLIVIGGTTVDENGTLHTLDDAIMARFRKLRDANKDLKLLVSLTPSNSIMSRIVVSDRLTSAMASSVANYLQSRELDGFDIDWEFPVWSEDARKTDKKGFAILLKKLRSAFNDSGRSLLITLAVGAPYTIADKAYDIAALNSYVDYVQIMNYDFHRFRKLEPFTGFNAPLRAAFFEIGPARWMTSDYSTRNWLKLGVPRSKILFGIPTYARGYHLLTKYLHFPYAPATGTSVYGDSITYPSICSIANSTDVSVVWNRAASSPYMYSGKEWLTFESQRSVTEKAAYARGSGLAGVMVFSLCHDDFEGSCGASPYPLTKSIKMALYGS